MTWSAKIPLHSSSSTRPQGSKRYCLNRQAASTCVHSLARATIARTLRLRVPAPPHLQELLIDGSVTQRLFASRWPILDSIRRKNIAKNICGGPIAQAHKWITIWRRFAVHKRCAKYHIALERVSRTCLRYSERSSAIAARFNGRSSDKFTLLQCNSIMSIDGLGTASYTLLPKKPFLMT